MNTNYEKLLLRYEDIIKLREYDGLTLQEIGDKYSISRERVRQILEKGKPKTLSGRPISSTEAYLKSVGKTDGRERARELVRIRDNHTCQDCGIQIFTKDIFKYNSQFKTQKGKKKSLDVHHINGLCGKNSTGYDSTKDISGMITLCHKCHYNRPEHECQKKEWGDKVSNGWAKNRHNKQ